MNPLDFKLLVIHQSLQKIKVVLGAYPWRLDQCQSLPCRTKGGKKKESQLMAMGLDLVQSWTHRPQQIALGCGGWESGNTVTERQH